MANSRPDINFKNYKQYKPSQLIAASIFDIEGALNKGWVLLMSGWFGRLENTCCVCLGGAVLAGMDETIACRLDNNDAGAALYAMRSSVEKTTVAKLFDAIRVKNIKDVVVFIQIIYGLNINRQRLMAHLAANWRGREFYGELHPESIVLLKNSVWSLVDALREIGL